MEVEGPAPTQSPGLNFKVWGQSMAQLPALVSQRTFLRPSKDKVMASAEAGGEMKRVLKWYDVISLGVGIILGSGIYVTTGSVASSTSGPAVIISYIIAGLSAVLSGLCYTEFAVDFPVAGGSYTYVLTTFGELMAWFTVGMMVIQYMLANAGVARGFSGYFANLCGQSADFFIIGASIDIWACALIAACTALLIFGTKESALFNNICNLIAVACVLFVIVTGFVFAHPENLTPFTGEFGWRGIFNGASIVFFSYIGFDAISTAAQEVINPKRDLPIGLIGSLSIVTTLYILASLAIVMMVPYNLIDPSAAFSAAFVHAGATWASYIVAAGACIAIATGVLVGCMTVPRLVAAAARESLIPRFFGTIHPKFGTPWIATLCTGGATAAIALFTSLDVLLDLTSICVLTVYGIVSAAALWRRYYVPGSMTPKETSLLTLHFVAIFVLSILLGCFFIYELSWVLLVVTVLAWGGVTVSMSILCKPKYIAEGFAVPFQPYLGSAAMLFNFFLLCTVPASAFVMYAIFLAILVVIYLLFGIHNAQLRDDATEFVKEIDEDEEESSGLTKGDRE